MSRSLAPSPIAIDRGLGQAQLGGELAQRARLAGPVDDVADDLAGELAVDDLELVGAGEVDAEVVGEPVGDLAEAAGDEGEAVAEPAQDPDERAGAGREHDRVVHRVERRRRRRPPAASTRSRSDSSKSRSPRIAASVTSATSLP